MFKKYPDDRSKSKSWDKGPRGRDTGRAMMHKATCSQCGAPCQVPFKPMSGRPILCSDCFKRDGDMGTKKFSGRDARRPSFDGARGNGGSVEDQLKTINAKLDKILEAIEDDV